MDVAGIDLMQLWDNLRPFAESALKSYGPNLLKAGVAKLHERTRNDPAPACAAAEANARNYATAFGGVVDGLYVRGQLKEKDLARAIASPAIARVLEEAILTASLTADATMHHGLAQLVAARLRSPDDSTLAFTLRDACERIESLHARHLRALAVVYFAKYGTAPATDAAASNEEQITTILGWIKPRIGALGVPTVSFDEASHLDSLHLIKYRSGSSHFDDGEYDYSTLQQRFNLLVYPGIEIHEDGDAYRWINVATSTSFDYATASRMALTSTGAVLGYAAYCNLVGEEADFSLFDDETPSSTTAAESFAATNAFDSAAVL